MAQTKSIKDLKSEFSKLIQEVDAAIKPLIDSIDIQTISGHNAGYRRYAADKFHYFVECEKNRFIKALDIILRDRRQGIISDIGCFIPYLPVALSLLGYEVRIADRYELYGGGFKDSILELSQRHRLSLFDLDIVRDYIGILGKSDIVLLMAVVEHLHGTPRFLFKKVQGLLKEGGIFLFEVPNIAAINKRFRMLFGGSPLPDYNDYFESSYPFTGHSREMTVAEVRYLFHQAGFRIKHLECYDYENPRIIRWRSNLIRFLKFLIPSGTMGQSILVKAEV
jgi:SAM-dependent methyltransferase